MIFKAEDGWGCPATGPASVPEPGARRGFALFRTVGADDLHIPVLAGTDDANAPGVAADLAVLHEGAGHVGLEINLDALTTVRTRDEELIVHDVRYATVALYSS